MSTLFFLCSRRACDHVAAQFENCLLFRCFHVVPLQAGALAPLHLSNAAGEMLQRHWKSGMCCMPPVSFRLLSVFVSVFVCSITQQDTASAVFRFAVRYSIRVRPSRNLCSHRHPTFSRTVCGQDSCPATPLLRYSPCAAMSDVVVGVSVPSWGMWVASVALAGQDDVCRTHRGGGLSRGMHPL